MLRRSRKTWVCSSLILPISLAGALSLSCSSPEEADSEAGPPPAETSSAPPRSGGSGSPEGAVAEQATSVRKSVPQGPPIEGFQQLMPRGGIPALVDPQFVTAAQAEVPDEAWVLGFEFGGQAYAYDLNLLNRHEVVNHTVRGLPVAAVW